MRTEGNRRLETGSTFRRHCVCLLSSHQKRKILPKIVGMTRILLVPTMFLGQV
jgi:hypothetical protein